MFSKMRAVGRQSLLAVFVGVLLVPTLAHARSKMKTVETSNMNKPCMESEQDIEVSRKAFLNTLDLGESEINKCCSETCKFKFTLDHIELITNLIAFIPASIELVYDKKIEADRIKTALSLAKSSGKSAIPKIALAFAPPLISLIGFLAKMYSGGDNACTAELKAKELINLRILRENINKVTKKELELICLDAQQGKRVPKNPQETFQIVAQILRSSGDGYPTLLDDLNPDCDQVSLDKARSLGCISAIYRYCIGQQQKGGIAQEVPTHSISAVCLANNNDNAIKTVTYEKLSSQGALCPPASMIRRSDLHMCQQGARNLCQEAGYKSGVIQDYYNKSVDILCFNADLQRIPFDTLSQQNSKCDSIKNISHPFCSSASHAYCVAAGYTGGLVHQENPDGTVVIACFTGPVHNISFSDRIPAYH